MKEGTHMTVKDFYESVNENYSEVLERIGKEAWIIKYLRKFASDGCFAALSSAIAAKDWSEGFKMSHSLKGLALNLGLNNLSKVSSNLCEEMRNGAPKIDVSDMYIAVKTEYDKIIETIEKIED